MYSDTGNTTSLVLGFPIRTSSDPRSVGSSPRHIAASHVLHRPLMPRHPPCALKHLQQKHKNQKTIQRKLHHNKPTPEQARPPPPQKNGKDTGPTRCQLDARNHYPRIKHHTPPPSGATTRLPPHTGAREPRACCLRTQQCAWQNQSQPSPHLVGTPSDRSVRLHVHQNRTHYRRSVHLTNRSGHRTPTDVGGPETRGAP
jgi:hypothetical protein